MQSGIAAVLASFALATAMTSAGAGEISGPAETANSFRRALENGNRQAVLELLAPEVLIYESGDIDRSRDDYAAHHLDADLAFLAKAKVRVLEQKVLQEGGVAWVATRTSTQSGERRHLGTETLVLTRQAERWRIVHVHWSSRRATPKDD